MNFHRETLPGAEWARIGRGLDMAAARTVVHHSSFRAERQNSLQRATAFGHFRNMSKAPTSRPGRDASSAASGFMIAPDPDVPGLSTPVTGVDRAGSPVTLPVVTEKPVTLFLNRQEIVTSMTIGDWPANCGWLFSEPEHAARR